MKFTETELSGAFLIDIERLEDSRGFFARAWCAQEFSIHGLPPVLEQASISYNIRKGTLRGMHFSGAPSKEGKLVRCIAGRIFDVIIDLRPNSPTFLQHCKVELSAAESNSLYVPPGLAHGFQTLEDHTEILYMMTESYVAERAAGFRWNDPAFGIVWPDIERHVHDRDQAYADFSEEAVQDFTGY
ncbi:MAG: dTDP-4-dehydrorhamnose 3,5-epimerase family protein [Gammaproteobacteria bacterium]|nr:dTDP-4-dehydrorhamnose 3,5-epimerase family protein [Gammaproteobacteria bacterium]